MMKKTQKKLKKVPIAGSVIVVIWATIAVVAGFTFSNFNLLLLCLPFIVGWALVCWPLMGDERSKLVKVISTATLSATFTWLSVILITVLSFVFHGFDI